MRSQPEHDAEYGPDAGRPGKGEGHAHQRRRPGPELRRAHIEASFAGDPRHHAHGAGPRMRPDPRRQGTEHHHNPEENDHDAAQVGQRDLVRFQYAADCRRCRAERHEHHGEARHEQADAPQDRTKGRRGCGAIATGLEFGRGQTRDHGDVARHEGSTQGERNDRIPAPKATRTPAGSAEIAAGVNIARSAAAPVT